MHFGAIYIDSYFTIVCPECKGFLIVRVVCQSQITVVNGKLLAVRPHMATSCLATKYDVVHNPS